MLTVTLVDDLVALLVIATAYSRGLDPRLVLTGALFALVAVLRRIGSGHASCACWWASLPGLLYRCGASTRSSSAGEHGRAACGVEAEHERAVVVSGQGEVFVLVHVGEGR
jgi:hypothetical protein